MTINGKLPQNLPYEVSKALIDAGIKRFTDIQQQAVAHLFSDRNLVIVAPSGSGKTLIAELIIVNDLFSSISEENNSYCSSAILSEYDKNPHTNSEIETKHKAIYLVPLRALAEEKANHFATRYGKYGVKIHTSMSEIDFNPEEIMKSHILISTFERFKIIMGRMPKLLAKTKNIVIDEFHLIGDKYRGGVVETIITTLKNHKRLILLSATVENAENISNWLQAKLLTSGKRPIPLNIQIVTTIDPKKEIKKIIRENMPESQLLIFCGTRRKAEEFAQEYSNFIEQRINRFEPLKLGQILSFLETIPLTRDSKGNTLIYELVQKGTAFHHAGLSRLTQKAIEELFRENLLKVLFCTETLGAGINLPAREVIILDTKRWNNEWLSRNILHQIAGRAGRPNLDPHGKCTIFAADRREERAIKTRFWNDAQSNLKVDNLGNTQPKFDEIHSRIHNKDEFMKIILTIIYYKKPTMKRLVNILTRSFYHYSTNQLIQQNKVPEGKKPKKTSLAIFFRLLLETNTKITEEEFFAFKLLYPINKLEIQEIFESTTSKTIVINENNKKVSVTITKDNRLRCSCSHTKLLCKHRVFLLEKMSDKEKAEVLNENFGLIHKLQLGYYVKENNQKELFATIKGRICSDMGTSLERFEFLIDWLLNHLFPKKPSLTQLLHECINLVHLNNHTEIPPDNSFRKPLYDHIILGQDLAQVTKRHGLYEGDLLRYEVHLKALITGLAPLADFLGLAKISKGLENLDKIISEVIRLSY